MLVARLLLPPSSFLLAGPHLPALDRSGPRRTSTPQLWSAVGLAGPQPARVGALWAPPDLNCQLSIAVGIAGPQRARF